MKTFTYKKLMSWDPCYDPVEIGMPENWQGTIFEWIDEFRGKVKNPTDVLWVVLRNDFMTDQKLRLYACWCAEEALKLIDNPDRRSIQTIEMAKKYAVGEATAKELITVNADAWITALDAAWLAACDQAWFAARAATSEKQIDKLIEFLQKENLYM